MPPATTSGTPELLYLLAGDPADLAQALAPLRSADVAEALSALPPDGAAQVMAALPFDLAVKVIDEPELARRHAIFERLNDTYAGPLIEAMAPDQQAELFRNLSERESARLLRTLDRTTRARLEQLLAYPPETAGGIMTTAFVAVPGDWTVERVLAHIRQVAAAKETVYPIYVLDPTDGRLTQVVSLRELLTADRMSHVSWVGERRTPVCVGPFAGRDRAARLIAKYDLLAVPVVDDRHRVIGIVTVDDVIDALLEEHADEVQHFGGMEALDAPYMQTRFGAMVRKRAGWLSALFLSEMLTATAMGHFATEISRAVVLALFVPLIISSGGNSGSQATSLIIRALALREVRLGDWWRVALRELPAGLALGAILGTVGLLRILLWQWLGWYDYGAHYALIAVTVAASLIGVVMFGSLAGSMLPFLLRRLGFDPASASAPFVATLVDVTGLVIYFGIALVTLRGTLL